MKNNQRYFDRDLSWLSFNKRVLEEAADSSVPLYERIKFLAIYSSNLDEFFRVRVAALRSIVDIDQKGINQELGMNPKALLKKILKEVNQQLDEFGNISRNELMPALRKNNIIIYSDEPILKPHRKIIKQYFRSKVLSYMQPVIINEGTNLFLENRALYLIVELKLAKEENEDKIIYANLNIPTEYLPRYLELPPVDGTYYYIHLDDIIRNNIEFLFPGYSIKNCYSIKLNRDAELYIDDEYSGDLVEKIRNQLSSRKLGLPSRFLYDKEIGERTLQFLVQAFSLKEEDLVPGGRYHNRSDMMSLPNPLAPKLQNKRLKPIEKKELESKVSLYDAIDEQDIMLHFPFHSYDYVLRFFNEAAIDSKVKEIRATFYRVAADSFIMNALISAAKNGKKVTVFLELKARFDEENNLKWAERMGKVGVNIIYSIPGIKVHAKMALVIREVAGKNKGYAYLGTGNFNEKTAGIYADHGLLTCHKGIIEEVRMIFDFLNKSKEVSHLNYLLVSQFNIIDRFKEMIDREIKNAKEGKIGKIVIKVNNLQDERMIEKLYEANSYGVKIDLIIRAVCCLVPEVSGLSENITVTRIVDQFLEHARVFVFYNNGNEEIYMGSADWMHRNLSRRVEVVFPILDQEIKKEVMKMINLQLKDNTKARKLDSRQNNLCMVHGKHIRAQTDFYKWLKEREKGIAELDGLQ